MVSESQADSLISSQPKHFIPSPESASVQKALRVGIKSLRPKEGRGLLGPGEFEPPESHHRLKIRLKLG